MQTPDTLQARRQALDRALNASLEQDLNRWSCPFCGYRNHKESLLCENCGTPRDSASWRQSMKRQGASFMRCPRCNGLGYVRPDEYTISLDPCPVCNGTKRIAIPHVVQTHVHH
jgi:DnaJ-class molecular chaperone